MTLRVIKNGFLTASLFTLMYLCASNVAYARDRLHLVVEVPDRIEEATRLAIEQSFSRFDYTLSYADKTDVLTEVASGVPIVGIGYRGCEVAVRMSLTNPVYCTLLSQGTATRLYEDSSAGFAAIVADQPIERQMRVATAVFPNLKRFGMLVSTDFFGRDNNATTIDRTNYEAEVPLVRQIRSAIETSDALLAIPDEEIFRRDTLRTVLLTTYGYAKPVVGYSRAYVDAGALITTWSSPAQLMRQTAELVSQPNRLKNLVTIKPKYFSVYSNESIARSLDLISMLSIPPEETLVDGDIP